LQRSLFESLTLWISFSYIVLSKFSFSCFAPYDMSGNSKQKLKFILKVYQINYKSHVSN
jgi:hypothetical protein